MCYLFWHERAWGLCILLVVSFAYKIRCFYCDGRSSVFFCIFNTTFFLIINFLTLCHFYLFNCAQSLDKWFRCKYVQKRHTVDKHGAKHAQRTTFLQQQKCFHMAIKKNTQLKFTKYLLKICLMLYVVGKTSWNLFRDTFCCCSLFFESSYKIGNLIFKHQPNW